MLTPDNKTEVIVVGAGPAGISCDEFEKRGIDVQYLTMSSDDPALKEDYSQEAKTFLVEQFIPNRQKKSFQILKLKLL